MKNNTIVSEQLQVAFEEKTITEIASKHGYTEKARKATVHQVMCYQMAGAIEQCGSYRELEIYGSKHTGVKLDHSTLSRKCKEIPYEIAMTVLGETMEKSNRAKRRKLEKEYNRFIRIFDTTFLIDTKERWNWAPYRDGENGIKVHVSYQSGGLPDKINIGAATVGDTAHLEEFGKAGEETDCVLADRGFLSVAKFCHMDDAGRDFIIRIPERVNLVNPVNHDFKTDSKYTDVICSLCKDRAIAAKYRKRQFRVVSFAGTNGTTVTLCTNIYSLTADEIAGLYRMRWNVETFFKTLKQNFSLKKIFGSSMNAVFSQVIINFIAYIVLFTVFSLAAFGFSFLTFIRLLRVDDSSLRRFLFSMNTF
jgi:hypothetical protein